MTSKNSSGSGRGPRSLNFTVLEKEVLLDLATKYKDVLENNKTDGASVQEKKNTWVKLTNEFNSHANVNKRGVENLKTGLDNIKKNSKKNISGDKVRTFKTGGGSSPSRISTIDEKVIALIGPRIIPLQNKYDSDADYNHEKDDGNLIINI